MGVQYFEQADGRLAYDDEGTGPLAVCAPSMGDVRGEYRFLTPQLVAAGWRVVTVDVRGHGASSVGWPDYSVGAVGADLVALIRHLNAGPAVLIGDSMAGGAAVWAAAEAPGQVAGLVLLDPFVRGESNAFMRALYAALFARPWGPAAWTAYYASLYPTRKPAGFADYVAALRANLQEPGRLEAVRQMLFASKAASEARLARVTAPTLVLMGSRDPDFKNPEAEARWVAEQLHGAYEMVAEAGHYPHAEFPEVTGPRVLAFLKQLARAHAA